MLLHYCDFIQLRFFLRCIAREEVYEGQRGYLVGKYQYKGIGKKAVLLDILEVATVGQTMSLYSSSASWLISQLMNRGSDPANVLSAYLQNRVTVELAQGLRNPTETSREFEVIVCMTGGIKKFGFLQLGLSTPAVMDVRCGRTTPDPYTKAQHGDRNICN